VSHKGQERRELLSPCGHNNPKSVFAVGERNEVTGGGATVFAKAVPGTTTLHPNVLSGSNASTCPRPAITRRAVFTICGVIVSPKADGVVAPARAAYSHSASLGSRYALPVFCYRITQHFNPFRFHVRCGWR
jgi:hypothetical protein